MAKIILFIQSDPRTSPRPCEAIRIALGLAACDHAVDLILGTYALPLLDNDLIDVIDGEKAREYLVLLKEFLCCIIIEKENAGLIMNISDDYRVVALNKREIAQKMAATECFFMF